MEEVVEGARNRCQYTGREVVDRPQVPHCTMEAIFYTVLEYEIFRLYKAVGHVQNVNGLLEAELPREPIPPSTEKGFAKVVQCYVVLVQTHTAPSRQFTNFAM